MMMRTILLGVATLGLSATPALANEARVEVRGGAIWDHGDTQGIVGAAAGYDFDVGTSLFVGPEVSGDKVLEDNTRISLGLGGRVGLKMGAGKLYAVSAYQTKFCRYCDDSVSLGGGYQHSLGTSLYGKVEYRHYFFDHHYSEPDAVTVGVGMKF